MPKKGDRPTKNHILAILEPYRGKAMRFSDIKRALIREGWIHTDSAISDNFKVLIEQGKLVKVEGNRNCYGIPAVRENGTAYIQIMNFDFSTETIELGKIKPNA
jgi:hypothetical protein